jgi:outer membrane protein assembly factor BamB
MAANRPIYIGICGNVLAVDRATGVEIWRSNLKSGDFVNVVLQDEQLYATTQGELFRLDPATGHVMWHNPLKGLGLGVVTIAGQDSTPALKEKTGRDQANAAIST